MNAVRRAFKRIGWTLLAIAGIAAVIGGVLAWRATRVPAWYAAARTIAPNSPVAADALNGRLIPLQNWIARTSAGRLDDKPAADKLGTLTLTEAQINALLALAFDQIRGRFEHYRVRLTPDRIDLACDWTDWHRTLGLSLIVAPPDAGPARVGLGNLRLGEQAVPMSLLKSGPLDQFRTALAEPGPHAKPYRIDEHDLATERTVEAYYGRLLLDLLAGRSVTPLAFLPGSPSGQVLVATQVQRLDVAEGTLTITFRMLGPDDRTAVVAALDGPLPPP